MEIENKSTRHHGSKKRPNTYTLSLTDDERDRALMQAKKAKVKGIPALARKLLNKGAKIVAPLSEEERKAIAQLAKIGPNLWQLCLALRNRGVDNDLAEDLESFRDEMKDILNYCHDKLMMK